VRLANVLLRELETKQGEVARQALEQHGDGDAFTYGRACGVYAGLAMARQVVLDAISDEDDRDI
jgi:hypothetical protein